MGEFVGEIGVWYGLAALVFEIQDGLNQCISVHHAFRQEIFDGNVMARAPASLFLSGEK